MLSLKTHILNSRSIKYDGCQLAPHWIYRELDVMGDAIVAFEGEANVTIAHLVDLEDVKKQAPIYSPSMLHFLGEWFIDSLDMGILLQHLLVGCVYQELWEAGIRDLKRRGNDIYFQGRKFSVSIATRSPVSVLLHLGLNIKTEGTPVPTSGLEEMKLDPWVFAQNVLARFAADNQSWRSSRVKVRPR